MILQTSASGKALHAASTPKSHKLDTAREWLVWSYIAFHWEDPGGTHCIVHADRLGTFLKQSNRRDTTHSIGNMSSLEKMNLVYNNLEGSIPHTLSQLKSLTFLQISANKFDGLVPAVIYNMSSLNFISMAANQLQGEIPQDIGLALPNLKHLSLGGNRFSGVIPESLSNISQLQHLDLSVNSLMGKIPSRIGDGQYDLRPRARSLRIDYINEN
ncbi:hypothetical protein Syun_015567 [Stephania yunnanensis]|uniref:Uncharacterized protein n=1 Tax=Stephania yunnanensis TaxID=152371 RepID=A0AAP0P9U6_9MAGN